MRPHNSTFHDKQKSKKDDIIPKDCDVLCGRGGRTFSHPGNENYRQIIFQHKERYALCRKKEKVEVSKEIVLSIQNRSPPTKFLEYSVENSKWEELSEERAVAKVSQALREGQKDIRRSLETRPDQGSSRQIEKESNDESDGTQISQCSTSSISNNNLKSYPENQRKKHEYKQHSNNVETNASSEQQRIKPILKFPFNYKTDRSHSKKPTKLSFDSLSNFTTSREITGSPIRLPGQKKIKSCKHEHMEDEKENVCSSKSKSFDDTQVVRRLNRRTFDSRYDQNALKNCPSESSLHTEQQSKIASANAKHAGNCEECIIEGFKSTEEEEDDEIRFIKDIFSCD